VPQEGDITVAKKVTLEELGYEALGEKVAFWQGDACNLKPNFTGYDLVIATNLIDRLYNPKLFLEDIAKRINSGGVLVLTSPYTWQESSTAKELWLGGYYDEEGNAVRTIDTLHKLLEKDFDFLHNEDVEFVIAETARKHQHTVAQLSVWKRK
jgi:putative 4-mercaptohistidine N1-methyltranferase